MMRNASQKPYRIHVFGVALGLLCAPIGGCAPRHAVAPPPGSVEIDPLAAPRPPQPPPAPGAEAMNTEYYRGSAAEETAAFAAFATQIQAIQRQQAGDRDQPIQRGFHAKAHGCVAGVMQLYPDRQARTRFGIFADDYVSWPLWARFSNGVGWRQTDNELDARGLALKLQGVPGAKLLPDEPTSQDFLMTNAPTPVGGDAVDFMRFAHANANGKLPGVWFTLRNPTRAGAAVLGTGPVPSMTAEQYWSGSAYHLGAHQAVKFTAKPCDVARARGPVGHGAERLADDLASAARAGMCFEFYVQFQVDPIRTPIEDASREWREVDAPLVPVGRITFPPQELTAPDRRELCDRLTFNPWHALPAHQPMGHINRARRYVYEASQAHRRAAGNDAVRSHDVPVREP